MGTAEFAQHEVLLGKDSLYAAYMKKIVDELKLDKIKYALGFFLYFLFEDFYLYFLSGQQCFPPIALKNKV